MTLNFNVRKKQYISGKNESSINCNLKKIRRLIYKLYKDTILD